MRFVKQALVKQMVAVCAMCGVLAGVASAQPTGGRAYDVHRVEAQSNDYFTLNFRGGEQAVVAIEGDGDTDLDLYVYDENGNLIVSDTGSSDSCRVYFTPRWTGAFRIVVVNRGYVHNVYEIAAA